MIPLHPNIVEMAALLEDPTLKASQRNALQRALHETVRIVKKRDGSVSLTWTSTSNGKSSQPA